MANLLKDLNSKHIDILREIGNIGAGNAATALAQLINKKIIMRVPEVNILSFDEVIDIVGGPESMVAGIYLRLMGGIEGNILFIIPYRNTLNLLDIFFGEKKRDLFFELSPIEKSALAELGNILAGSYLSAISFLTKMILKPSVPALALDMAGAILSVPLTYYGHVGDTALLINTVFEEGENQIKGHFFLIPDVDACDKLFFALGGVGDGVG